MMESDDNKINAEANNAVISDKTMERKSGDKREDLVSQKLLADSLDLETGLEKLPL